VCGIKIQPEIWRGEAYTIICTPTKEISILHPESELLSYKVNSMAMDAILNQFRQLLEKGLEDEGG
jgi:hypothetical protein